MTDMQLLTLVITLLAIFGAMYGNRKSTEDMRDVLRAEFRGASDTQRADFKVSMTDMKSDIGSTLQRIENKLDHYAEVQASHSERLNKLDGKG